MSHKIFQKKKTTKLSTLDIIYDRNTLFKNVLIFQGRWETVKEPILHLKHWLASRNNVSNLDMNSYFQQSIKYYHDNDQG